MAVVKVPSAEPSVHVNVASVEPSEDARRAHAPSVAVLRSVPALRDGSSTAALNGALAQRILQALALLAPDPVDADELSEIMWGDARPEFWQSAMRTHVTRVRSELLRASSVHLGPAKNGRYCLDGPLDEIDAVRFLRLVDAAAGCADPQRRLELLEAALALWSELPADDIDSRRVRERRELLERAHATASRDRLRALVELGRPEVVVSELQTRAHLESANEAIVEPYVSALLSLGRRADAHDALERSRLALAESGLSVGLLVDVLRRRLIREEIASASQRLRDRRPRQARAGRPFVGRDALLRAVKAAIVDDQAPVVLLRGSAGVGKSRLLRELVVDLRRAGTPVVSVSAVEHGSPGSLMHAALGQWSSLIAHPEQDAATTLATCLEVLGQDEPAVFVVEDVHFADLASLKSLRRLLQRDRIENCTLVLTARSGSAAPFARDYLTSLENDERCRVFDVGALRRDDVYDYLVAQGSAGVHNGGVRERGSRLWTRAGRVHELSGGLPLLMELVVDRDLDDPNVDPMPPLPGFVAEASTSLSDATLELLVAASLGPVEIDLSFIAEVGDTSIASTFDAFDEAHHSGLVEQRLGRACRFRHDLVRRGLQQLRSVSWRCRVHHRMADVLEARGGDEGRIALHRAQALADARDGTVVASILNLAEQLQTSLRWEDSLRVLELCEGQLSLQPWLFDDASAYRLRLLLAHAHDAAGDASSARESFRAAYLVASSLDDPHRCAEVAVASAGSSQPLVGDDERSHWLRDVVDVDTVDPLLRLEAVAEYVYLAGIAGVTDDVASARDTMRRLAEVAGGDRARGTAAHGDLVVRLVTDTALSRKAHTSAALLWTGAVSAERAATAHFADLVTDLQLGRLTSAERAAERIRTLAETRQRSGDLWLVSVLDAFFAEWRGDDDAAIDAATTARTLARRHGVAGGEDVWALFNLTRSWRTGDWQIVLDAVKDQSESVSMGLFERAAIALVSVSLGERQQAQAIIDDVVGALVHGPRFLAWLGVATVVAEASVRVGSVHVGTLRALLQPWSGEIVVNGLVPASTFGPLDRVLARLAAADGDDVAACALAAAAARTCRRSGLAGWDSVAQ